MLEIQKISKKIKTNDIVSAISLKLKKSEVVGLLGPNGAGKTTCFYMISGLIKCDSGKIILDNKEKFLSLMMIFGQIKFLQLISEELDLDEKNFLNKYEDRYFY